MNKKEHFNRIIDRIEDLVRPTDGCAKTYDEIVEKVFADDYILNTPIKRDAVFNFMLDSTVQSYIRYRRMMAVYQYILGMDKYNSNLAIEYTGFSDEPAFIKAFKKVFNVSPGKVHELKENLYKAPLYWDDYEVSTQIEAEKQLEQLEREKDITVDTWKEISKAKEYQSMYELDDETAKFAYDVLSKFDCSMRDKFRYVYDYVWLYGGEDISELDDEEVFTLYNKYGYSFLGIALIRMADFLGFINSDICSLKPKFIKGFGIVVKEWLDNDDFMAMDLDKFTELYQSYTETYDEYLARFPEGDDSDFCLKVTKAGHYRNETIKLHRINPKYQYAVKKKDIPLNMGNTLDPFKIFNATYIHDNFEMLEKNGIMEYRNKLMTEQKESAENELKKLILRKEEISTLLVEMQEKRRLFDENKEFLSAYNKSKMLSETEAFAKGFTYVENSTEVIHYKKAFCDFDVEIPIRTETMGLLGGQVINLIRNGVSIEVSVDLDSQRWENVFFEALVGYGHYEEQLRKKYILLERQEEGNGHGIEKMEKQIEFLGMVASNLDLL